MTDATDPTEVNAPDKTEHLPPAGDEQPRFSRFDAFWDSVLAGMVGAGLVAGLAWAVNYLRMHIENGTVGKVATGAGILCAVFFIVFVVSVFHLQRTKATVTKTVLASATLAVIMLIFLLLFLYGLTPQANLLGL